MRLAFNSHKTNSSLHLPARILNGSSHIHSLDGLESTTPCSLKAASLKQLTHVVGTVGGEGVKSL